MTERLRFDGRVAIITGAGWDSEHSYARFLADRGASVVMSDADRDKGRRTVDAIVDDGGSAIWVEASAYNDQGWDRISCAALREFGTIDVVIHDTGTLMDRRPADACGRAWLAKRPWTLMQERGYGRILFIASDLGRCGVSSPQKPRQDALCEPPTVSEVGLTRYLAKRGTRSGINVNAIWPFPTPSPKSTGSCYQPQMTRDSAIGRQCVVDTVLPVMAWLVHEQCGVTGEIYQATGGRISRVFVADAVHTDAPGAESASVGNGEDAVRQDGVAPRLGHCPGDVSV